MNKKNILRFFIYLNIFLYSITGAAAAEVIVIVNPSVEIDALSQKTLLEIYKNEKTIWDSGKTIKVVLQVVGNTHKDFSYNLIEFPPSKLKRIWRQVIFTGTGNMPKLINTEKDIVKYVSNTNGAIGYIDSKTPHDGTKVLKIN